ncbi:DUF4350 domain-containing protein [Micromonospora sp. CPCC 205711]|uniref:DUF4350 domain-containing protein n=1 Tax=Micromonospora sp. CPCC 205547 TaxID=3122400 RepID=UPI002FEFB62C
MTATATATAAAPAGQVPPPPRRRRRHRVLIPLAAAALLLTGTLVMHAVDQPDPADPGYLSPVATDDDGGSRLAEALRAQGVTVQRETDPLRAFDALDDGRATLFVPAPELLHPRTLRLLGEVPAGRRLLLVDPSRRLLESAGLPLVPTGRRWATRAVDPSSDGRPCPLPEAARAGTAAAHRQRYAVPSGRTVALDRCYGSGLVRVPWSTDVVVIGAGDPFRNDRIGEWGNAALATGLLSAYGRVIWLDLDGPAAAPPTTAPGPGGDPTTGPGRGSDPTPGPGQGDPTTGDGGAPGDGTGDPSGGGRPGGSSGNGGPSSGDGGQSDSAGSPDDRNPLWDAFPPWFWALLAQLALAALLLVLWRGRRLGPPVAEPLPVRVRAAETVLGRARLYQHARARGPAASTLRAATLDRLRGRLQLPAETPPAEVAARVAARAGGTAEQVHELLYGAEPESDAELLELARSLDRVTRTVTASAADPTEGDHR